MEVIRLVSIEHCIGVVELKTQILDRLIYSTYGNAVLALNTLDIGIEELIASNNRPRALEVVASEGVEGISLACAELCRGVLQPWFDTDLYEGYPQGLP